jgi:hypothetical protein
MQNHLEGRSDALQSFEADTARKAALTLERLSYEEEQLRIKDEHVAKVEHLVMEEQSQVWDPSFSRCSVVRVSFNGRGVGEPDPWL